MRYIKTSGSSYEFTVSINQDEEIIGISVEQLDHRAGGPIYPSDGVKLHEALSRVLKESHYSSEEYLFLEEYRDKERFKDKDWTKYMAEINKPYRMTWGGEWWKGKK